jgi:hypothetical protein
METFNARRWCEQTSNELSDLGLEVTEGFRRQKTMAAVTDKLMKEAKEWSFGLWLR